MPRDFIDFHLNKIDETQHLRGTSGWKIPAGSAVCAKVYWIMNDDWEDPELFNPDRFLY